LHRIAVQKNLLSKLRELIVISDCPGFAHIRVRNKRRDRVVNWGLAVRLLYVANRSGGHRSLSLTFQIQSRSRMVADAQRRVYPWRLNGFGAPARNAT